MNKPMADVEMQMASRWGVAFERINVGDVTLRVAVAGSGPAVILCHGFPESWYSWRYQVDPLVAAGYQVLIPDMRGYGGSDSPSEVNAYDMASMTADIAGLVSNRLGGESSVVIGHDWGAPIAWNSARLYPELFRAVAGLSVPYVPPGEMVAIDLFRKVFTDQGKFFYMVYFQDEGVAEQELEADPFRSIHLFYTAIAGDAPPGAWPTGKPHGKKLFDDVVAPPLPRHWIDEQDVSYYAAQFEHSGFRGPLNRYRNFHRDSQFLRAHPDPVIHQPSLFITGDLDPVSGMYPDGPVKAMAPFLSNLLSHHVLAGCGHWTQQERPDEVNALLLTWLDELAGARPAR